MRQEKRRRDIKSKLIAAICMLLVSSIMMVSTTYAWFTLSTAPEVTGINTSVGANGNLEMALLPMSGRNDLIFSNVGDSMSVQNKKDANITWGNLVDLDDVSYGLSQIQLMPAALMLATETTLTTGVGNTSSDDVFLRTPKYGADGRVSELENTLANGASVTGTDTYSFLVAQAASADGTTPDSSVFGVRGIGTASAMTPRQQNYRSFRASASNATAAAQQKALGALAANGQTIANMAVNYALGGDEFLQSDMDALQSVVTAATQAVESIEDALTDYIKAAIISKNAGLTDVEADVAVGLFSNYNSVFELLDDTKGEKVAAESKDVLTKVQSAITTNMTGLSVIRADYEAMAGRITSAQNAITTAAASGTKEVDGSTVNTYTWTTISGVLTYIANPNSMKVNGMTMEQVKADKDAMVQKVIDAGFKVTVDVPSGSGIFADIADFSGDYQAPIKVTVSYGSLKDVSIDAVMSAQTTKGESGAPYLPNIGTLVAGMGAPEASTSGTTAITDLYGYAIDLVFRTNAATGTKLQLQTAAIDRIYGEDGTTDTQGGGANMTFTGATGFGEDKMIALMENINVVFFDTFTGDIYGVAKLDVGTTPSATEGGEATKNYTYTAASNEIKANLVMMNWSVADKDDGLLAFNGQKGDAAITTLNQNAEKNVSVLVYLDGNTVTNGDVANAAQSMTGKLNLQFSTDTALTPMEYTPLMNQDETPDPQG